MAKKIDSIKHSKDKRVHIPSKEEAGYEDASKTVQNGKKILELPKNPVVHRGQDPELFWMNKYGNDDRDDLLRVDIRSLYRHEHIAPETLIKKLYTVSKEKSAQESFFNVNELFGNALEKDELEKVSEYYRHSDGWTNRLIQGDSHLVMASLLEREGMAGQVQMIYIDPPYGIKYGSNWQVKLNNRDVKDGSDESLAGEPEVIKAFRDTWELGIHSYLTYLRDRLLIAKELLTESGSCFVQISDENVHLVRSIMDEVFGSENFINEIVFATSTGRTSNYLDAPFDRIIFFAKDKEKLKYRELYYEKNITGDDFPYTDEKGERFDLGDSSSQHESPTRSVPIVFNGKTYLPPKGRQWAFDPILGLSKLVGANRIYEYSPTQLRIKKYITDFPYSKYNNAWLDTQAGAFFSDKKYVVQTTTKVIQRCLLMTTDPGDLVLDPTCGSGTTAYVAEQYGRRWITLDTSRIALNIAKQRLTTAVYPYYTLYDEQNRDIRQGFIYKTVPHITLKSLANNEPPSTETLYDQPEVDKKILRVSGPFTVETLQNFEPISPEELSEEHLIHEEAGEWTEKIKQHLLSTGIKNGRKDERVQFSRIELLADAYLHAEGFYQTPKGEQKSYFHIGPKFGTVSKEAVNKAVKECQLRGNAAWLVILGFSFESDIESTTQTFSLGTFEVTKARIHDDLLQEGLKKKPSKSAASFITIGEPDIELVDSEEWLVDKNKIIVGNYAIVKKLSGLDRLAKINGLDQTDLSTYIFLSQRRDIWINFADAKGIGKHPGKYSGGSSAKQHRRVSSVLGDSERFFSGIADFDNFIEELGISESRKFRNAVEQLHGDSKITERAKELACPKELNTVHYTQATILGLDIYDPIKDEVKARNVSDIAYWMVDDNYDGSNFVVKQIFFCGGDKDEFEKWKKGLSEAAKQETKRKAEKTLKIEIDDEAFDRLYGHISHPIEIKNKGQKIAVRVISQFGEETTKVITI